MTSIGLEERRDTRIERLCVLASQALNVLWFDGSPDETVSGRSYREGYLGGDPEWERRRREIDRLFLRWRGEKDHCRNSHLKDVRFAEMIRSASAQAICPTSSPC
jgi:hypothetical protein